MNYKFDTPTNWTDTTLGTIAKWGSGGTPLSTNTDYYNGEIPWLIIGDLNDSYVSTSQKTISQAGLKNSSAKMVKPDSILIAMYGSIGKLGINKIPLATNQAIAFTEELNTDVYNKFLFYYLYLIRSELHRLGKGGTQKNISQTVLKQIRFAKPHITDQHQIVEKIEELFSELDKGIENLKTAQQQLKVYRQAVLKWAFEGKLTKNDKDWEEVKLGKVGYAIDPQPSHRTPPKADKGIPFVSTKDFDHDTDTIVFDHARIVPSSVLQEHLQRYELQLGDFVIGKIGTIGKPVRIVLPQNYALSANIVLIQPRKVNPTYLYYFFQSSLMEKAFLAGQSATSQAAFGIQKVRELDIRLPSDTEQLEIVEELESRLSVCDKMEEIIITSLLQAEALRQSILKRAFEGKLVKKLNVQPEN